MNITKTRNDQNCDSIQVCWSFSKTQRHFLKYGGFEVK